jgi:hypothetical protein
MKNNTANKTRLTFVLCAAWILSMGANAAVAGEITGNGKVITVKAKSACVYSGLQDDAAADEGVFKSDRTQNWGQLTELGRFIFAHYFGITSPSQGCNPTKSGGDAP